MENLSSVFKEYTLREKQKFRINVILKIQCSYLHLGLMSGRVRTMVDISTFQLTKGNFFHNKTRGKRFCYYRAYKIGITIPIIKAQKV